MATVSTTFTGVTVDSITAADPGVITANTHGYTTGDLVLHEALDEMTELNGQIFDILRIDANSYNIRTPFGNGANLSTAAFTAEDAPGGTSSLGLSAVLIVPVEGDDITITLTGTWVATIALEKEIGFHSNAWTEVERWTANTFRTYQSKAANQRWRLRLITWTSGTITGVLADVDKIEEEFLHDDGTPYLVVTQDGATFQENLTVNGGLIVSGNGAGGSITFTTRAGDTTTPQGGDFDYTGGAGDGSTRGGRFLATAGQGGATGTGAGAAITAGAGGSSSGAGGIASILGGAGTAGNAAGGISRQTAGAGQGSAAGGVAEVIGGAGGDTGIGGATNITGGAGGASSGAGGASVIAGGAATTGNTAGGLASVTGGASTGSGIGGVASVVGGAGSAATGVGGGVVATGGAGNTTGAGGSNV